MIMSHRGKRVEKDFEGIARLQILEKATYWDAGPDEHRFAAHDLRVAVYHLSCRDHAVDSTPGALVRLTERALAAWPIHSIVRSLLPRRGGALRSGLGRLSPPTPLGRTVR